MRGDTARILSPREAEVVILKMNGATNVQVAEQLRISVKTVEAHWSHVTMKLQSHYRSDAKAIALVFRAAGIDTAKAVAAIVKRTAP